MKASVVCCLDCEAFLTGLFDKVHLMPELPLSVSLSPSPSPSSSLSLSLSL